jgi:acyl dehydratase
MSSSVVVRYRTKPEAAEENARLIKAVFAALAELGPTDFRYTTYRLADGVTFVHAATVTGDKNPLSTLPAFAEFQREIAQRCEEPPAASDATIVASYG